MNVVLDTHAAIWALLGSSELGRDARTLIQDARPEELILSDISLLEVSMLLDKSRLQIQGSSRTFLHEVQQHVPMIGIEPDIALEAMRLDLPHGDPFDRVITATASVLGIPLVTKDRLIQKSGCVETIW